MAIENQYSFLAESIKYFIPEIVLVVTYITGVLVDLIVKKNRNIIGYISIIGMIIAGVFLAFNIGVSQKIFSDTLAIDPFSTFFKFLTLITTIIISIMSFSYKELYTPGRKTGEYYSMLVGMTFGMFILSSAINLITIYLSIEILSLSSYVLAGYTKENKRSSEASLKYVIYGSLSSGIMVYGMSLLFGVTMTLDIHKINEFLARGNFDYFTVIVSTIMILVGFGYKISAVPFHYWTPDVYEGAPITITAFLSVASKAAGFAVFVRFFNDIFYLPTNATESWSYFGFFDWTTLIALLSVLTMTVGNFAAIWQENVKRLLAYSSIAHAGYILMGVVVLTNVGITAILLYFVFYLLMNLGAFFIAQLVLNETGSEDMKDYIGLGYRSPILAVLMTVFLISLTGLPPTAGFIGKLYIFSAVLEDGWIWLAVIGVLNSVVSLFYYVKIIMNMFLRQNPETVDKKFTASTFNLSIAYILAILVIVFGLYFSPILDFAAKSVVMIR